MDEECLSLSQRPHTAVGVWVCVFSSQYNISTCFNPARPPRWPPPLPDGTQTAVTFRPYLPRPKRSGAVQSSQK